jgi:proline racemase
MRSDRVLGTIDFHTAGIGMRLLTSGLGRLPGRTIAEKRRWFEEHLDPMPAACRRTRSYGDRVRWMPPRAAPARARGWRCFTSAGS